MLIFISDYFSDEMRRGAELSDEGMLSYIQIDKKIESSEVKDISNSNFYIISNFVQLSENIKKQLIQYKNYIIYEHDHKYTATRNPFINPDGTTNSDGLIPKKFLINLEFYKNAKQVICQTSWHQKQLEKNISANLTNIHGSFYTQEDLELLSSINKLSINKKDKYAIFNDSEVLYFTNGMMYRQGSNIKNKNGAIKYCIDNHLSYIFIPRINNKINFWKTLSSFKHFIFLPDIPETCSRLLIEAKMLGVDVITNNNSGAANEDWFKLQGQDLIDHFKNKIIPEAVNKIKDNL